MATSNDPLKTETKLSRSQAGKAFSIQSLLPVPWKGLRPDIVLYEGPIDYDGQRSWVLEDPVRGNNFRLGYAEAELLFRLSTESDPDRAAAKLYQTTTLRPTPEEIVRFILMLQKEHLAILPEDHVIEEDAASKQLSPPSTVQQMARGNIFFKVPLLRPDTLLTRLLPWVSFLWAPACRWFYLICGLTGLGLTLQEIEIYFSTVNYLFTPQGSLVFFLCLILLKVGHEFAHAFTAKAMGLHVRTMGVLFIVIWPLLYTDTTDAWKVPDRRRRMAISAAGVLFELTIGGLALLFWAYLPDGILKSLMFFLSSASLVSSVFINLNPFMRYDGYYILMDLWGIDNLRPRSFALLRYTVRRILLDWQGPIPEIHPNRRWLITYGFCAMLYRLFIGITIAVAVYYLFFPLLGLLVFVAEVWLFIVFPLSVEIRSVLAAKQYIGSRYRLMVSAVVLAILLLMCVIPIPRVEHVPCLFLYEKTNRIMASAAGQLDSPPPEEGRDVKTGDLLSRLKSDALVHEMENVRFDLAGVRASMASLSSGGEQGGYRKWLKAEEERLSVSLEKYRQAIVQLEIHAPYDGQVVDSNIDLYQGAFVGEGDYLFTIADSRTKEVKAYIHERLMGDLKQTEGLTATVHFAGGGTPALEARLLEKSVFPVTYLPNDSLYDISGGPIVSMADRFGYRPRDAYFAFTFSVKDAPDWLAHGMPSWIWMTGDGRSLLGWFIGVIMENITSRGLI